MAENQPSGSDPSAYQQALARAVAAKVSGDEEGRRLYSSTAAGVLSGTLSAERDAASASVIPVRIVGLQRTGTNLATFLLHRNFRTHVIDDNVWKHGRIAKPDQRWKDIPVRYVLCVKNPYAQLVSCYRYFVKYVGKDTSMPREFRANMTFKQFLKAPCYGFASPLDRWNRMYAHWLDVLPADLTITVRQEDQLRHQPWVLGCIQRNLGLLRTSKAWQITDQSIHHGAKPQGSLDHDYYQRRKYLSEYAPEMLDRVNRKIDGGLLEWFGYQRETSDAISQP